MCVRFDYYRVLYGICSLFTGKCLYIGEHLSFFGGENMQMPYGGAWKSVQMAHPGVFASFPKKKTNAHRIPGGRWGEGVNKHAWNWLIHNCHNFIYYANQSQIEVKVVIQLYPRDMRLTFTPSGYVIRRRDMIVQVSAFQKLLVFMWCRGSQVGGQEQKHFSPLATKLSFMSNSSRKNYIVLTPNMISPACHVVTNQEYDCFWQCLVFWQSRTVVIFINK